MWKEAGQKRKLIKDNGTRISKEDHEREGRKPILADGEDGGGAETNDNRKNMIFLNILFT